MKAGAAEGLDAVNFSIDYLKQYEKAAKVTKTSTALITALLGAISTQLRDDPKKDKNTDVVLGAFDFIKTNKTFFENQFLFHFLNFLDILE